MNPAKRSPRQFAAHSATAPPLKLSHSGNSNLCGTLNPRRKFIAMTRNHDEQLLVVNLRHRATSPNLAQELQMGQQLSKANLRGEFPKLRQQLHNLCVVRSHDSTSPTVG